MERRLFPEGNDEKGVPYEKLWTCSTRFRWRIGTRRATSTNTCSARSPHHHEIFIDEKLRKHFHEVMLHGYDSDNTMLRIGSMNMLLHGIANPDIAYRDSLAQDHAGEDEKYSPVLALFLRLLKPGGRAAVLVPDGVLFGSSKAHKQLRTMLIENQKLDAVVKLPSSVFKTVKACSDVVGPAGFEPATKGL